MKMGPRHSHLCHEALGEPVSPLALARDVSCKKMVEHGHLVIYIAKKTQRSKVPQRDDDDDDDDNGNDSNYDDSKMNNYCEVNMIELIQNSALLLASVLRVLNIPIPISDLAEHRHGRAQFNSKTEVICEGI
jgi:hypothetical protein